MLNRLGITTRGWAHLGDDVACSPGLRQMEEHQLETAGADEDGGIRPTQIPSGQITIHTQSRSSWLRWRNSDLPGSFGDRQLNFHMERGNDLSAIGRPRLISAVGFAAALVLSLISSAPSHSADSQTVGQRYQDGLDSRHSASSLTSAAKSVGYTGNAWTGGRSATNAWNDALSAQVIGYFGHANAGAFQVDEGATNATDQFIGAGFETDVVSLDSRFRWWGEYWPFADVDDVKLAVMAGCYTANEDEIFGQFSEIGKRKGIDSVVGFAGLVYYPANCTDCVYSGNYFWDRFSVYAKNGNTVSNALSKAKTDLVAKEGDAGGWGAWRIGGSVTSPGSVKLKPAGSGTELTSHPAGISPYTLSGLDITGAAPGTSAMGPTTEVDTGEGVSFRRLAETDELLDVTAPASTKGDTALTLEQAETAARTFMATEWRTLGTTWELVERASIDHSAGEKLASFQWRRVSADGVLGAAIAMVEVDRRTGAVTYFSHTRATPSATSFSVSEAEALDAAAAVIDTARGDVSLVKDVWNRPRWTVTVDRGLDGLVPDVDRVVIDGVTGEVLAQTTA